MIFVQKSSNAFEDHFWKKKHYDKTNSPLILKLKLTSEDFMVLIWTAGEDQCRTCKNGRWKWRRVCVSMRIWQDALPSYHFLTPSPLHPSVLTFHNGIFSLPFLPTCPIYHEKSKMERTVQCRRRERGVAESVNIELNFPQCRHHLPINASAISSLMQPYHQQL